MFKPVNKMRLNGGHANVRMAMFVFAVVLLFVGSAALAGAAQPAKTVKPIQLHPENGHCFLWRGKPTVLITSGEHYGAVLNRSFNYKKYFRTLASHGFNLTRTFSGAYCEPVGAFRIKNNTLAPAKGQLICPWARSDKGGYANGGNKAELVLALSRGTYRAEWVNTKTGKVDKKETFRHTKGNRTLYSPRYIDDIALRIKSLSK